MARDWTLSGEDREELGKYRTNFRLFLAVQLCAVRLYGRFYNRSTSSRRELSIISAASLGSPGIDDRSCPIGEPRLPEQRQHLLDYLGFQKFDEPSQAQLETWLKHRARIGVLPEALFPQAEKYLLARRILLPGPSVLERLIIHICSAVS